MNSLKKNRFNWWIVVLFATGMAWVEAAVVFYLRSMIDRIVPYQPNPLPKIGGFGPVEFTREFATMIMLLTVGMLAGRTWRSRMGYTAIAFGVWDIFYYVFLKMMCDWPRSLMDWDILFLIPLPWWGPVLAPVMIALLMIVWGTLASQLERAPAPAWSTATVWGISASGMAIALTLFMADTFRVSGGGVEAIRNVLPEHFNWPLFGLAFALMSAPVAGIALWTWLDRSKAIPRLEPVVLSQKEQA